MTDDWVPRLSALAPDSGCYMSEADPRQPDWKTAFYGPNYQKLYSIKKKYDPNHVFYAPTAVGNDDWQVQDTGALCWSGNEWSSQASQKLMYITMSTHAQSLSKAGGDPSGWYVPPWSEDEDREFSKAIGNETTILSVTAPGACIEADWAKASKLARQCNEYSSALKKRDPRGYGFFASLPSLFDVEGSLKEIAYAFDKLDADGITLFTRYGDGNYYLGHDAFEPIWAELNRRRAVVFIHPTHPVSTELVHPLLPQPMFDYPHETGRTAISLIVSDTLCRFPDCKIILSHAGGTLPYLIHRTAGLLPVTPMSAGKSTEKMLQEASSFYFDTAISANPATLKALFEIAKPGHVLFGTDFPNAPTPAIMRFTKNLETFDASPETLTAVFSNSALALFPRLRTCE
ncbi:MAG: hypothetical protein Q9190_000192 [Brigantiaea leucoxantha]